MTIINPKSIAGVTSITTPSGSDNLFTVHTNNTTERIRINNDGDVIVGSGITVSPDGDIFATGVTTSTTFVGALTGNVTGNISGGTVAGSTGTFTGDVDIADKIVHTGDTDTAIRFSAADTVSVETGGTQQLSLGSATVFNETGADVDFRIESDDKTHMFFVDAGNNRIGVNVDTPLTTLHAKGSLYLTLNGSNANEGNAIKFQTKTGGFDTNYGAAIHGLRVGDASSYLRFDTGGQSEKARLDESGRLFLGATSTDHANRTFVTSRDSGNYISIITDANDNCGITFGDSTNGTGNYETYIAHANATNDFTIYTSQGSKSFTFKSGGDLSISDGNLVIGTAGHGIDFSATADAGNSGSTSSELLDDYEEGTWIPDMHDGSVSYNSNSYTKVGRLVTVQAFLYSFTDTSTNDQIKIGGLPYAAAVNGVACGTCMYQQISETNNTVLYMNSQTQLLQYGGDSGGFSQIRHNELSGSSQMYIHAQYFAGT